MAGTDTYEVVIVGGGHNGLICGTYLAKSGTQALILEARDEVGGCASTVNALGTRVNICNCDHVLFRATKITEELELDKFGLSYLEVDPVNLALFWDEHQAWFIHRDIEATVEEIARHYPDQVDGYRKYCATAIPLAKLIVAATNQIPTFGKTVKTLVPKHLKALATLQKWQRMSALEVLSEFFSHEALILPALGLGPAVWGVDVASKGTGLGALTYGLRHLVGVSRPAGGSGSLTQALAQAFQSYGGEIKCANRVQRIEILQDTTYAIELESGEELHAKKIVVACDPRDIILNRLKGTAPSDQKFLNRWEGQPQFDGYESKIDAVVSRLPTYKNVSGKTQDPNPLIPTAVITPSLEALQKSFRTCASGSVPELPIMLANYPTALDPAMFSPSSTSTSSPTSSPTSSKSTNANAGVNVDVNADVNAASHIMSLEVLYTPYALAGGWKDSKEPERWLKLYDNLLEEADFSSAISNWRCMTPLDYESDFNLARGYAPSFSGSPIAAVMSRQPELTRYKSPIKGLFFTGAGTFPGAGIWGASGRNTAKVVLKQSGSGK